MGRLAEDPRGQAAVCSAVVDMTIDAMFGLGVLAPETVMRQALLAGVCFHAYQQVRLLSEAARTRERSRRA